MQCDVGAALAGFQSLFLGCQAFLAYLDVFGVAGRVLKVVPVEGPPLRRCLVPVLV